ncbi:hypothetical protein M514_11021 [Trichuris suis]|uniref:Transposase n=1 Tax=Trichuris suis TaxID=68888 RepID=A0A085MW52_9BILA|nr:hypothetical protein M514_11021 [Trichuris suis]
MCSFKAAGEGGEVGQVGPPRAEREADFQTTEVCSSLLSRKETDPFLDQIVTVDEKWVLNDNRRRSWQCLDSDEPPRNFPKPPLHLRKTMLIWSHFGIVHFKFLKAGQWTTTDNYWDLLEAAMEKLLEKRPALANRRRVILLQITRDHTPREKRYKKLANWGWNLCLTHHIQRTCGQQIITCLSTWNFTCAVKSSEIRLIWKMTSSSFLNLKKPAFYAAGINVLVSRWKRCTNACGSYF